MKELILELFKILKNQYNKKQKEQEEFMEFYEFLVKNVPESVATQFGNLSLKAKKNSNIENFGLELNVVDYGWWREKVKLGYLMVDPTQVKLDILDRLATMVEIDKLSDEDKDKFLNYLKK